MSGLSVSPASSSKVGLNISIATVDEHLQTIGAESFAKFERSVAGSSPIISRYPAMLTVVKCVQEHGQL